MSEFPHILAQNKLEQAASVSFTDGSGNPMIENEVYPLAHLTDRSRGSLWKGATGKSEQRVAWGFDSAVEMDTFVLDRNFTIEGASATVYFQHSANGTSWTTAATISGLGSGSIYWRTFNAVSRQFWRLRITGLSAQPQIYNLWAGKRIELTFGPYGDFDPYEEEIVGEAVHGASGAFQWNQRFRRRVLRAAFENLINSQYELLELWWNQAAGEGKNWWWLTFPQSEPVDPLYLNCEGAPRRFAITRTVRYGTIEAREVI